MLRNGLRHKGSDINRSTHLTRLVKSRDRLLLYLAVDIDLVRGVFVLFEPLIEERGKKDTQVYCDLLEMFQEYTF